MSDKCTIRVTIAALTLGAPDSAQTADSPTEPPSPAPEVTAPVGTPQAEDTKKEKGATPPPPK